MGKGGDEIKQPNAFWVVYRCQQADGTDGAQTPMRGGRSYHPLDDILPPPAEDMIDTIGEELDDGGEMRPPYPRCFPRMKTGFQIFKQDL